ncbi:MerR family transcriptional regulator [Ammonicoccus fulvus]|uniref:MerR family transcriptional regulator n=1 Tax=Ammonicoccus fulvus TaxID=3138240 RepID=A0ABZ3FWU8_9ACTN
MRMAELSRESGLPVATIKFYLREGLLPPGERTSPNQARYSDEHVRRLRLTRALIDVGGLSVASARAVLDAMEEGPIAALATAQDAMVEPIGAEDQWSRERYEELVQNMGWEVYADSAAAQHLRDLLVTARNAAGIDFVADWSAYAEHADAVARHDLAWIAGLPDLEGTISGAVVGTVLGAAYFNALRMLAHQHYSKQRWPNASLPPAE